MMTVGHGILIIVLVGMLVLFMKIGRDERRYAQRRELNKQRKLYDERSDKANRYLRQRAYQDEQVTSRGRAGERLHRQRRIANARKDRELERKRESDSQWGWGDDGWMWD